MTAPHQYYTGADEKMPQQEESPYAAGQQARVGLHSQTFLIIVLLIIWRPVHDVVFVIATLTAEQRQQHHAEPPRSYYQSYQKTSTNNRYTGTPHGQCEQHPSHHKGHWAHGICSCCAGRQ